MKVMLNLFQHLIIKVCVNKVGTMQAACLVGCRNKFGMTALIYFLSPNSFLDSWLLLPESISI